MLLREEIIGNIHQDKALADMYAEYETDGRVERIILGENDRKRSRLRTTTDRGTDVGIVVDRPAGLAAGDVVAHDDERMIVISAERQEALVIELDEIDDMEAALDCGHRLGNQHQDLAIEDGRVYIPIPEERAHVERVIKRTLGEIPTEYEQVDLSRFESRNQSDHHGHHDSEDHTHDH